MGIRRPRGALAAAAACAVLVAAAPALARELVRVETLVQTVADGPQRAFVARVDLRDRRVVVRVSGPTTPQPQDPPGTEAHLETVATWAEREGALLALNANFFARLGGPAAPAGAPEHWTLGQPVDLIGPSVSQGRIVSHAKRDGLGHPALLLTRAGTARIACALEADLVGMDEVVAGISDPGSGGCLLVEAGVNRGVNAPPRLRARHPRTAAGLTRDRRTLILAVVDGRQPGWSIGMTLEELGALMLRLGARDAINLDGGGSASFLYRPERGAAISNRPSDGSWRPVANQLGVVLQPRR